MSERPLTALIRVSLRPQAASPQVGVPGSPDLHEAGHLHVWMVDIEHVDGLIGAVGIQRRTKLEAVHHEVLLHNAVYTVNRYCRPCLTRTVYVELEAGLELGQTLNGVPLLVGCVGLLHAGQKASQVAQHPRNGLFHQKVGFDRGFMDREPKSMAGQTVLKRVGGCRRSQPPHDEQRPPSRAAVSRWALDDSIPRSASRLCVQKNHVDLSSARRPPMETAAHRHAFFTALPWRPAVVQTVRTILESSVSTRGRSPLFQLRRPGRGITILIALHGVAFVSTYILGGLVPPGTSLLELLALNPADVFLRGRIWQPITAVLFHAPGDVFDMFSTALWLLFLGAQVESMVGTRKLLETYAWTAAGSVVLTMVVGLLGSVLGLSGWTGLWGALHIGPTGAILGLIACWVARMDRQVIHFALLGPMQARTFGILLLVGVALARFLVPAASLSMHLGGIAMGYAIGTGRWPPNREKAHLRRKKKQLEKELRRFEVIEGGRSGQPKDDNEQPRGWTGWNDGGPTVH